jgi:glycosyl transferase family 87
MRRASAAALLLLAASFAATLWAGPWADERVNDLPVYLQFAQPVLHGGLPYRDVFLEYPPLAAPVIALPGLVGTDPDVYRLAFAAMTLLLAAAVVLLCGRLAALTGGGRRRALAAAALAPLLTGAMIRTHIDLAPVALTLGALALLCGGRPRLGLAVLGLGAMTKGFPLVAAPPALAWLVARGERRAALEGAGALVLVVVTIGAAAVALSPSGATEAVRYQLDRPVQIESSPATVLLALDGLGLGEADSVASHRSDGLTHPADGVVAAAFSAALLGVLALLTLEAAAPLPPAMGGPGDARRLVLASLAAIVAFAALGKVLSPQFMVWLVPLGALAFAWRMHALALATGAAIALTLAEFPSRYFDLVDREPFPLALVALRNVVLLCALALAARALVPGALGRSARASRPAGAAARST